MLITPNPTTTPTRRQARQPAQGSWCADWGDDIALFTDHYELTMVQAYWRAAMLEPGVASLFARRLPPATVDRKGVGVSDFVPVD